MRKTIKPYSISSILLNIKMLNHDFSIRSVLTVVLIVCILCGCVINYNLTDVKLGTNLMLLGSAGLLLSMKMYDSTATANK